MSISERFYSNISWNIVSKAGILIVTLALSIIITRYLGQEKYGIYASILIIPSFTRFLNSFGLETVVNKSLPEFNVADPSLKSSRYLLRRIFAFRFVSTTLFSLLIYTGLPYYLDLVHLPELIVFRPTIIFYFAVTSINSLYSTLFMTFLRYKITGIAELASYLLNLGFLILFIYLDIGIEGVLRAYIIATVIKLGAYVALSARDFRGEIARPDTSELGNLAKVSYLSAIFSFGLLMQSDLFLMNYFSTPMERVGFYQLATTAGTMLTFILMGIQPMALSLFSETYEQDPAGEKLKYSWGLIVKFALLFSLPVYVFVFYDARELLSMVYGEGFAGAETALRIFLAFLIVRALTGADFFGITLYAIKKNKMVLRSTIEASAINIILNIMLIPAYAEAGALIGTGLSVLFIGVRRLPLILEYIPLYNVSKTAFQCLLFSAGSLIPVILASRIWPVNPFLDLFLSMTFFTALLYTFKPVGKEQQEWFQKQFPRLGNVIKHFSE